LTRLGSPQHNRASGSLDELLDVGVGDDQGLVVNLGGMLIEGVGGLGAEVAVLEVEVKRADAVRAADTGELRASLDPVCSVVSHDLIVSPSRRGSGARWSGGEGNGAVGSSSTSEIGMFQQLAA
jgi:hypothetical protein